MNRSDVTLGKARLGPCGILRLREDVEAGQHNDY